VKKLAVITTHPIQYYAPLFALLHRRKKIELKVFYTWGEASLNKFDPGFGKAVVWDVPLLEGYPYEWVENTSSEPGSHHPKGIVNPNLIYQVEAFQPNAVLVIGWAYTSHLKAMRYFKGKIPVYFRGDSTLLDRVIFPRSLLKNIWLRWVYHFADHAFYVGTNNKAYLNKFGLKDTQLSFTPHAIDNERFAVSRKVEASQLRKEIGVAEEEVLILFAGKFEDKKSPVLLLNAFLTVEQPGVHLLFIGNGVLEGVLKKQAAKSSNVHFIDFQNQKFMPVAYQACDLFCLPSKGPGETWGLAVNEAMACGKAVLSSDKAGCAIDLVGKENGAIFISEDEKDLENTLAGLVKDKNQLKKLGQNSLKIISPWNFGNIAEAIEHQLLNEAN
jgi:glycosyltransferase involved in cell wall biosynthesis